MISPIFNPPWVTLNHLKDERVQGLFDKCQDLKEDAFDQVQKGRDFGIEIRVFEDTVKELLNLVRSINLGSEYKPLQHCRRGHLLTPENTKLKKNGHKLCRRCESYTSSLRYFARKGTEI